MTVVTFPNPRPARLAGQKGEAMDVILHLGAHRCATTTFQHYMRQNAARLSRDGIGFWGPHRTRTGLFRGILPGPSIATGRDPRRRAVGRVRLNLTRSALSGTRRLLVSEENMLGSMRENLRQAALYPSAGERLVRYGQAFDGQVTDVLLNIRSQDLWWASALGYGLARGFGLPSQVALDWIAGNPRGWRDVITDVACALPGARIWVLPFEIFAGRPEAQLATVTGRPAPREHSRERLNPTPDLTALRGLLPPALAAQLPKGEGRWTPFTPDQAAALREAYADDLMWLAAGADGLAWLVDDLNKKSAGQTPPTPDLTRGKRNDQDRRLAGAG